MKMKAICEVVAKAFNTEVIYNVIMLIPTLAQD